MEVDRKRFVDPSTMLAYINILYKDRIVMTGCMQTLYVFIQIHYK